MVMFFVCIFAMVLRHAQFIVKMYVFSRVMVIMRPIYYKFLVKYDALSTHRNNEKTGVF